MIDFNQAVLPELRGGKTSGVHWWRRRSLAGLAEFSSDRSTGITAGRIFFDENLPEQ